MLDHVLRAIGRGDVGLVAQVELGHVDLVLGQHVAQVDHALARVRRVGAVREAARQLGEVVERLQVVALVAARLRAFAVDVALDHAAGAIKIDQAAQVIGIIDVLVGRIRLDEAVHGRQGIIRLVVLVLCVGQLELGLLVVFARREARDQALVGLGGGRVVGVLQRGMRVVVQRDQRHRVDGVAFRLEHRTCAHRHDERQHHKHFQNGQFGHRQLGRVDCWAHKERIQMFERKGMIAETGHNPRRPA